MGRIGRINAEPGPHALSSVSTGNRSFPYDLNGNMTVIDGLTNTWDFKDRLIQVEDTNMVARYTYDYTDRRVAKRVTWKTASTNNLTGLTNNSVLYPDKYFEVREADSPVKYVWNGNTRVARVTGSLTTSQRTQRLRVYPGFNMVSFAVTAPNALAQLKNSLSALGGEGQGEVVRSAQRWNSPTFAWVTVTANETLTAGTVLWLNLATNATLTVTGTYAEPANQTLQPGATFVAGWGLQPLPLSPISYSLSPATTTLWAYNNQSKTWRKRLTGELQTLSDVPAMLAPGDAVFARPEVVSTLTVPESALAVRYYHQDHLGSSSVLTDAAGALVSETANYAFGFARNEFLPRNLREPYGFTQKERDAESQLHYFAARYLPSRLPNFVSVDPLNVEVSTEMLTRPGAFNTYAYCSSRPLVFTDPSGCQEQNYLEGSFGVTCGSGKAASIGVTISHKWGEGGSMNETTLNLGGEVMDVPYSLANVSYDWTKEGKEAWSGSVNKLTLSKSSGHGQRETLKFKSSIDASVSEKGIPINIAFTIDATSRRVNAGVVSGKAKGNVQCNVTGLLGQDLKLKELKASYNGTISGDIKATIPIAASLNACRLEAGFSGSKSFQIERDFTPVLDKAAQQRP